MGFNPDKREVFDGILWPSLSVSCAASILLIGKSKYYTWRTDEWRETITLALHKGKGGKNKCNSYIGISLLSMSGKGNGSLDWEIDRSN